METLAFLVFILLLIIYGTKRISAESKKRIISEQKHEASIIEIDHLNKRLIKILKVSDSQHKAFIEANEKLEILKVKAEDALAVKSDFLAKMSH